MKVPSMENLPANQFTQSTTEDCLEEIFILF